MMNNGQSVTIDGSTKKQVIKDIEITNDEYQDLLAKQFDDLKIQTINQVDNNTKALFGKGFQFNDLIFSMSANAVAKIQTLQLAVLKNSEFGDFVCNDINNMNTIVINKKNAQEYIDAFVIPYVTILQSDTQEKEKVRKLNTLEELQAYIDPRL